MPDENLINYIKTYSAQGYDEQVIRSALASQGYTQEQISSAFKDSHASHMPHIPIPFVLAGVALFLVVAAIVGFVAISDPTQEFVPFEEPQQFETPVQPAPTTPQEQVEFEAPVQDVQEQVEQPISTPPPQDRVLSRYEIERLVIQMAADSPEEAAQYCPQILTTNGKNDCYAKIAIASQTDAYCNQISTQKQKDFCYMQFAVEGLGNDALCAKIQEQFRQESCLQILQLQDRFDNLPEAPEISQEYSDPRFNPPSQDA